MSARGRVLNRKAFHQTERGADYRSPLVASENAMERARVDEVIADSRAQQAAVKQNMQRALTIARVLPKRRYGDLHLRREDERGPEALQWLRSNRSRHGGFASEKFGPGEALRFVEDLYRRGARRVQVFDVHDEPWRIRQEGGPYAKGLIVTLPNGEAPRESILRAIGRVCPDELHRIDRMRLRVWWD